MTNCCICQWYHVISRKLILSFIKTVQTEYYSVAWIHLHQPTLNIHSTNMMTWWGTNYINSTRWTKTGFNCGFVFTAVIQHVQRQSDIHWTKALVIENDKDLKEAHHCTDHIHLIIPSSKVTMHAEKKCNYKSEYVCCNLTFNDLKTSPILKKKYAPTPLPRSYPQPPTVYPILRIVIWGIWDCEIKQTGLLGVQR